MHFFFTIIAIVITSTPAAHTSNTHLLPSSPSKHLKVWIFGE